MRKTATSSAYQLYEIENEPLPNIEKYNPILNSNLFHKHDEQYQYKVNKCKYGKIY